MRYHIPSLQLIGGWGQPERNAPKGNFGRPPNAMSHAQMLYQRTRKEAEKEKQTDSL